MSTCNEIVSLPNPWHKQYTYAHMHLVFVIAIVLVTAAHKFFYLLVNGAGLRLQIDSGISSVK